MGKDLANRLDKSVEARENKEGTETLATQIQKMESQFALALPSGLEAKQLVRDALTVIKQTPKLQECEWQTVLGALMSSAQLGLRPGVLGQSYVLPFWDGKSRSFKAQFIVGYQGLIELMHRSGRVLSIVARTVYENDEFDLEYQVDKDVMTHRPTLDGDPGRPRLYYARATLKDGGYQMTNPLTHQQMEKHRDRFAKAKMKDGTIIGPWRDDFEAMALKTMVIKLAKMMPKSTELSFALVADEKMSIHTPGQKIVPIEDAHNQVIDLDAEDVTEGGTQADAIALRDEILAASNTAQVDVAFTRGERQGLLDFVLQDSDGEERELRQIATRRRDEL